MLKTDWHFYDLEIHELKTDVKVFSALRREYLNARRGILRWFSILRYSRCEFFQVRVGNKI